MKRARVSDVEVQEEVPLGSGRKLKEKEPQLNEYVTSFLTDQYQISMAYAYWYSGRHEDSSTFELFFRKNPFQGEFTVFAGLQDCLLFLEKFGFTEKQIDSLKEYMGDHVQAEFWDYLRTLDASCVKVIAPPEGTIVFPREPLLRVEGPLAVCQLLETTLLNLVNFPSLVATNAARHYLAAGGKKLIEFGVRRAQGPDGAISASRYSYMGGFDGTSNVLAGTMFGIPISGTHAHAFVSTFSSQNDLRTRVIRHKLTGAQVDLVNEALKFREMLKYEATNESELVAFCAYAIAYPSNTLLLVDTYDTLNSGVPNYICVALALHNAGYTAKGIRLDSGDLAYLSKAARAMFEEVDKIHPGANLVKSTIVASNDLNESTLLSLQAQGHQLDVFGIGTNLVTCQAQPALGCVYKLVQVRGAARIKVSNDPSKVTIPFAKDVYRLHLGKHPVLDLMLAADIAEDAIPEPNKQYLCLHPFDDKKRVNVTPVSVEKLTSVVWDGKCNVISKPLAETRSYVLKQLSMFREDHLRSMNPTPYKVSLSNQLFLKMHELWRHETPIRELVD